MRQIPITDVMRDANLFGPWFAGDSWLVWRSVLKAAYALPMTPTEIARFKSVAGGRDPPRRRVKELWCIVGRRGGKDSVASLIASHAAVFSNFQPRLRPGEKATVLCLATDRAQAKIVHKYIAGYFNKIALLKPLVTSDRDGELLELNNDAEIIIATNSYRAVRGKAYICAILSEVAFFRDTDSANPDKDVYEAIVPGTASLYDMAMIVGISTPYMRSGLAYEKYETHFGTNSDEVLVVHGPSITFNPTVPQTIIDSALARDPVSARAEYLAQWRDAEANFLSTELIRSAVDVGIVARLPNPTHHYTAFVDAAGGAGTDSFTCAISHNENTNVILDALYEQTPPFSPVTTVAQICDLVKQYRIHSVTGDKYAGSWPAEQFSLNGVTYLEAENTRSEIYQTAIPLFTAGRVRLLDNKKLVDQFAGLKRKVQPGGREQIDHGSGSWNHDDLCNAAAGSLTLAGSGDARWNVVRKYLIG